MTWIAYRGYTIFRSGPTGPVRIFVGNNIEREPVDTAVSAEAAMETIDGWHDAP